MIVRHARAVPTLLRIGLSEALAYRAEFLVWILTMTLPLVMLALWSSVAAEAPFRGFSSQDFVAYYLVTLIVRQLTSSWVAWQMNMEVQSGLLAMRVLRPIHPFVSLACVHLAAIPLRSAIALPIAVVLLMSDGRDGLATSGAQLAWFVPSIALAWLIGFAIMFAIGALSLVFTKALAIIDVYFGLFAILSGYTLPLAFLPQWLSDAAPYTPFPSMLAHPVAIVTDRALGAAGAAELVLIQAGWTVGTLALTGWVWTRAMRRFEAVGG